MFSVALNVLSCTGMTPYLDKQQRYISHAADSQCGNDTNVNEMLISVSIFVFESVHQ